MMNPIGLGLAVAATATLGFASTNGGPNGGPEKANAPVLDTLWQDGIKVSYKPGGGVTFAANDFSMRLSGRIQARWHFTALDGALPDTNSFQARRARTKIDGFVWSEDITYMMQMEHAGMPDILDVLVGWRFWKNDDAFVALSLGLQKFRAGLQSDISSGSLEFAERSVASATFANNRATGALLYGGLGKVEGGHSFMWHVGAMNNDTAAGSGMAAWVANEHNELNFSLGLLWAMEGTKGPTSMTEGDLAHSGKFEPVIGGNFAILNDNFGGVDNEATSINVYAQIKTGSGIAAQGEVFIRSDELQTGTPAQADSMGWYLQGTYTTAPGEGTQWGFGARVAMVTFDDPAVLGVGSSLPGVGAALAGFSQGEVMEISGVINAYYHEHKLKSQLVVSHQSIDADAGFGTDSDNIAIDVMATLHF